MKKNDWALLISVFLYSFLFYQQDAGINFLIFNFALVALLLYRDPSHIRSPAWLPVAAGALISSVFIFIYSSPLSIITNLLSLMILSARSIDPRTSVLTSLFLTICSAGSSMVFIFIDWINRRKQEVAGVYRRPFHVKLFLILIPFLIAVLFFFFYQTSSPLFLELTKDINLDFISIGWIFFTIGGLLLMYGFFHNRRIKGVSDVDVTIPVTLTEERATRKTFFNTLMRTDNEIISGLVLLSMLNILLLIVNALDLNYLWFNGDLPAGMKHKEFVHDGIGTLITSIIIAILIILFYFRGGLNFLREAKWLRILAYIWIVQNAFMICSTAFRNDLYIGESGLSYKKIGVYVYLLLALVGLISTFVKIARLRTNWYLFRVNSMTWYVVLVVACTINWDVIITDFNIRKHDVEKKALEKYLLLDLSFKNLPQLYALPDSIANSDDFKARDYYYSLRSVYFHDFVSGRSRKLYEFLEDYRQLEWKSHCTEKTRVHEELMAMRDKITKLKFQGFWLNTLRPLEGFDALTALEVTGADIADLGELKMFPRLEELTLNNCQLDTLDDLPALPALRSLALPQNNITDLSALRGFRNLEKLDLSGYNRVKDFYPLDALKKLKLLTIGEITPEKLRVLQELLPDTEIRANVTSVNYNRE